MIRSDPNIRKTAIQIAVVSFTFGVMLFKGAITRMIRLRKVQDAGSTKISSTPMGYSEVQGFAWPSEPVRAYVCEHPCVFFHLVVEEERGSGKSRKWVKVFEDRRESVFFVADQSGHAQVVPIGAEFNIKEEKLSWTQVADTARNRIMAAMGVSQTGGSFLGINLFGPKYRVTESVITAGSPVYILGTINPTLKELAARPSLGLGGFLKKAFHYKKNRSVAGIEFDRNLDGEISYEEWQVGFTKMANTLAKGFKNDEPMILGSEIQLASKCYGFFSHRKETPLFIADCDQHELVRRLSRWNWLRLLGGAFLLTVALVTLYKGLIV